MYATLYHLHKVTLHVLWSQIPIQHPQKRMQTKSALCYFIQCQKLLRNKIGSKIKCALNPCRLWFCGISFLCIHNCFTFLTQISFDWIWNITDFYLPSASFRSFTVTNVVSTIMWQRVVIVYCSQWLKEIWSHVTEKLSEWRLVLTAWTVAAVMNTAVPGYCITTDDWPQTMFTQQCHRTTFIMCAECQMTFCG